MANPYLRMYRSSGVAYDITIPVAPAVPHGEEFADNITRIETDGGYDSNIIGNSQPIRNFHWDFTLVARADFYETMTDWWDNKVIGANQLWCYIDYEFYNLVHYPVRIMNNPKRDFYVGGIMFQFSLDFRTKLLRRGEL